MLSVRVGQETRKKWGGNICGTRIRNAKRSEGEISLRKQFLNGTPQENTNGTAVASHFWERPGEKSFWNKMIIYSFQNVNITILETLDLARRFPTWKQFCQGCSGNCRTSQVLQTSTFSLGLPVAKRVVRFCSLMKNVIHPSWSHGVQMLIFRIRYSCSSSSSVTK